MNFKEKLGKEILFFDGAMGTMLQARGLEAGELPETWNVLHPDVIKNIHREYLDAGCNIVKTNTFGVNRFKFDGSEYSVEQLVKAGVSIAKQAIKESGKDALAALDIGSLGKLLKPIGELSFDDAYNAFKDVIIASNKTDADLILIETVSDTYEIKAAVLAAKENSKLPIVVTMIFDENGKLLTGGNIEAAVALLEGLGVDAIGFNCGLGPSQMAELVLKLKDCSSLPMVVNPNAGLPVVKNGQTIFEVGPEEFAESMRTIVQNGAHVIGGCCGTTPKHIAEVVRVCKDIELTPVTQKNITVVSSYTHAVTFGNKPLIIGERINPTGKSKFKQALRDNDFEYIFKEGIDEEENGADILDVNVGLPEIDEVAVMEKTVTGLQAILSLPLQIDTTNIAAMERALRIYNGKAMINSVNGKKESMDAVFPLVKKYGGVVVCLTLDENGIPETTDGRVKIAEKIIARAKEYGIDKKDLVIDTLVMTVSTGDLNGRITLDALKKVRYELSAHTVLGVSNISFGLPMREKITSTFFTMAMNCGLSAGIVNPSSEALMSAYYSFCTLIGEDPQCLKYISRFGDAPSDAGVKSAESKEMSLFDAIVKGMSETASKATAKLLETTEALEIIDKHLIPALDVVGKGFEEKRLFLPQLLMSADAAKAAFDTIRFTLEKKGKSGSSKSKIVIATVKGDIHDIGKNIVKVLLQNYGFDVIDLGKDVPPDLIVETVLRENVKLVGLSALMTTTVVNMEETIKRLRKNGSNCYVMVGGAVLTQEYADMIGADFYSKDAMGSVRYANDLYDKGLI
jgi:5-methyltetrahydrofolate--homocysteine methyltransferase